jgi:hypothetical protein
MPYQISYRNLSYMGQARKQTFFGRQRFPIITCPICNSYEPDTWLHVLLTCRQQHIHSLHVKRHNKAVWEIRKLLISSEKSRCYTLMNAALSNFVPEPTWAKPENKHSLEDKGFPPSHVLFVTHTNLIHGYMYYLHVGNNTYTHYTSKDITKQYGKLRNY